MLKPLLYIKRNKSRTLTLMIMLCITIASVYLVSALVNSLYATAYEAGVSLFSRFSVGASRDDSDSALIESESISTVEALPGVAKVYKAVTITTSLKTVFGTTSSYIFFVNDSVELSQLQSDFGLSLVEGRLPTRGAAEIALHQDVLLNKSLLVGDNLDGYHIVGALDGEIDVGLGSLYKDIPVDQLQIMEEAGSAQSILVFPVDGNIDAMNTELDGLDAGVEFSTFASVAQDLDSEFNSISLILSLICLMVVLSLSIAVAALLFTHYASRYDEFGIFYAMGYRKSSIRSLILKEMLIQTLTSWLIGLLVSFFVIALINITFYAGLGQSMAYLYPSSLLYSLLIPIAVLIFSLVPVSRKLQKADLLQMIERR
jgi:ABC-type antimicrobial peptide transport system permease subunit